VESHLSRSAPQLRTHLPGRLVGLGIVCGLAMAGLIARLAYLQLVIYPQLLQRSEGNRLRIVPIAASRGNIYDRKHRLLAGTRFSYSVTLHPTKLDKKSADDIYERLEKLLDLPAELIARKVAAAGFQSPYPINLKRDVDEKIIAQLLENQAQYPGIGITQEAVRFYPHNKALAHVLGYTGEITQPELEKRAAKGYKQGDIIGKAGLERIYDETLRGVAGGTYMEVDARGRVIRQFKEEEPTQGSHLVLSIDYDLQHVAEQGLQGKKGAAIAMDVATGEVLAMASNPVYDPNIFTGTISPKVWSELQKQDHPFHNRALNAYPPGSTYKIITTIAGAETGVVTPASRWMSTGSLRIGGMVMHDHAAHGVVDIEQAFAYSVNTVYSEIGLRLGPNILKKWADAYRLGQATGISLPGESSGNIPDRAWKRKWLKEDWYAGDNANHAIGQGFNQVTPLQACSMMAALGNGGDVLKPQLVRALRLPDGKTQPALQREVRNHVNLRPLTWQMLSKGMIGSVRYGTSTVLITPGVVVGAKTGTAQDPPRKDHAWIVALAPMNKPRIAIAVFVENGGWGGSTAGPIAKAMIDQYFGIAKPKPEGDDKGAKGKEKPKSTH
jgi:penicillin-binding protein 2